jgi:hypothetical protein
MSNSYTSSNTGSYTETEIKTVLGKVYDDFQAIDARNFTFFESQPNFLKEIRDDLYFLLKHNSLIEFQIQFSFNGNQEAIHYKVYPFGSIYNQDSPSGGTDYHKYPNNADISFTLRRKYDNNAVNNYMSDRGWGPGGKFLTGSVQNCSDYTSGNLSMNKSIIRS